MERFLFELVVPVVVLLVVLSAIAVAVVYALRQRRRDQPGATAEPPRLAEPPRPAGAPPAEAAEADGAEPPGGGGAPRPAGGGGAPRPAGGRERRAAPAPAGVVRPLSAASRERYLAAWQGVQSRAADRPVLALSEADTIVARLMRERGLPEQETRPAADRRATGALSASHRQVLDSYRAGHALEQANSSSRSDPEQVREGMAHLQRAFLLLVDDGTPYGQGGDGSPPTASEQRRPRTGLG